MAHLRFVIKGGRRVQDSLYRREGDNTVTLFFSQESLAGYARQAGFLVVLNKLVTVRLVNRASQVPHYRVFIQAILYKPLQNHQNYTSNSSTSVAACCTKDVPAQLSHDDLLSAELCKDSLLEQSSHCDAHMLQGEPPVLEGRCAVTWAELQVRR